MQITTHAICEQGARPYNDDAFADAELMAGRCVAVADGAGGHRGGAVASRIVTDTIMLHLAAAPQWTDAVLIGAVDAASAAVRARQRVDAHLREMSSTVTLLCLDMAQSVARWTHLGDSRIYFFRRGECEQLTHDHSVVQSFIDAGLTAGNGLRITPDRSMLYAAIGSEGDTRPEPRNRPGIADGDAFLLCTDGVWDVVPPHELTRLLAFAGSVREWVESIRDAVRRADKPMQDNYTALGVWLGSPDEITVIRD